MTIAVKSLDRRYKAHPQYRPKCPVCGVYAAITEASLIKSIERGLAEQNLQVVSMPDKPEGTAYGMIAPLVFVLRSKGIKVT